MIRTGERLRGVCGIYCVIHRGSLQCYVGSSVNIGHRLNSHISDAGNGSDHYFHKALRELGPENFDAEVLERCEKHHLLDRERFYIVLMDAVRNGFNTEPNPKNQFKSKPMSEIAKARLSAANKGRVKDEQWRANLSVAHKGKKQSEESKAALLKANKGRRHTPDHIEKRVAYLRGREVSAATREKIARGHMGKKHTPETKEKMRLAKLGRKQSAEHIAKRTAGRKGSRHTPETIERIKETKRRNREAKQKSIDVR
jgi:group I intron endonuclease